ncbi:MAG: ABC transporter ATP-binding protein [Clostridiales bacterium 38-18]|nr:MAG: ABC transporter ATP-binding protein [Clostridiales bacterium 38-18]
MIHVKGLKKSFKLSKKQMTENKSKEKQKYAVKGIDFIVNDNEIFGLLGPNGAGKTTTMRCLATLINPTEGSISVNGFDGATEGEQVRRELAFLTNELKLDTHFTPDYTARFFGRLHGLDETVIEERMNHLFDYFGVTPFRFTKINDLSTGMKQKLSIVVSLIHDPQVVIFDEPTNGLDIITARAVTEYLKILKSQGKTIIISTHMMHVAEKLCDRIAVIMDGEIKAMGTLDEIYKLTGKGNLDDAFFNLYETSGGQMHV